MLVLKLQNKSEITALHMDILIVECIMALEYWSLKSQLIKQIRYWYSLPIFMIQAKEYYENTIEQIV